MRVISAIVALVCWFWLAGCAVRHIVDPSTGRAVSSSPDRKSDQAQGWYKEVFEYQGHIVEMWCRLTATGAECRL